MIRLHVAWEGVEPSPNEYNLTYIAKLQEIVELCEKNDVHVLLDAH